MIRLLTAMLLLVAGASAQSRQRTDNEIRSYDFICFCNASGSTPNSIIKLDNNGEILLAALKGTTREHMKSAGLPYTESQLQLLIEWNLLKEHDQVLHTTIPMLDRSQTTLLRSEVSKAVHASVPGLRPRIAVFQQQLRRIHRERSAFTLLFSYVLDELVWNRFEEEKLIDPRRPLSLDHPFWTGVVWGTVPRRTFAPGTNSYGGGDVIVSVNWDKEAIPKMGPFFSGRELAALHDEIQKNGKISDAAVRNSFAPFGIADASGNLTIPVINRHAGDPFSDVASRLAADVSVAVQTYVPVDTIQKQFGLASRSDALVIAYHEFMWELLDQLAAEHIIEKPVMLLAPDKARPEDAGDLVFIIRTK